MDRVKNPITGDFGVKCSSIHIKEAWLQLQDLKKEVLKTIDETAMTKYNFSVEFVDHMIKILEMELL